MENTKSKLKLKVRHQRLHSRNPTCFWRSPVEQAELLKTRSSETQERGSVDCGLELTHVSLCLLCQSSKPHSVRCALRWLITMKRQSQTLHYKPCDPSGPWPSLRRSGQDRISGADRKAPQAGLREGHLRGAHINSFPLDRPKNFWVHHIHIQGLKWRLMGRSDIYVPLQFYSYSLSVLPQQDPICRDLYYSTVVQLNLSCISVSNP